MQIQYIHQIDYHHHLNNIINNHLNYAILYSNIGNKSIHGLKRLLQNIYNPMINKLVHTILNK